MLHLLPSPWEFAVMTLHVPAIVLLFGFMAAPVETARFFWRR